MKRLKEEAVSDEEQPMKPKPLLLLAPMFPTPSAHAVATDPPLLDLTPFRPSSSSAPHSPAPASFDAQICLKGAPISGAFSTPHHED
jgi:hypothetical protein